MKIFRAQVVSKRTGQIIRERIYTSANVGPLRKAWNYGDYEVRVSVAQILDESWRAYDPVVEGLITKIHKADDEELAAFEKALSHVTAELAMTQMRRAR